MLVKGVVGTLPCYVQMRDFCDFPLPIYGDSHDQPFAYSGGNLLFNEMATSLLRINEA